MKDTAANRKLLTVLVLLGVSWVLFFQPASHWSALRNKASLLPNAA